MADDATVSSPPPADSPFRAVHSLGFPQLLEQHQISLLVTTYQAGKLMVVRAHKGEMGTLLRNFDRPMGLAMKPAGLFSLGTRTQIWEFRNAPAIAPQIELAGQCDACYLPRRCHVTGDILGHEMAWVGKDLWVVNTLFSCLCTLDADFSFIPRWRPPFVTRLAPEDRCHLNGLACADGQPRFVTALGETDQEEGWRENKAHGGVLLDAVTGRVIARGLSMPHCPRVHEDRLWLLEGGTGRLQTVDARTGQRHTVAELPGFARGLAFHGPLAFVGLSRIRESSLFSGLPISTTAQKLRCGVWLVDLRTGQIVHYIEFLSGVEEVFAIEVLTATRFPEVLGIHGDQIARTYLMPGT
jgi:uncharacterized protein (TIGR03032 family)